MRNALPQLLAIAEAATSVRDRCRALIEHNLTSSGEAARTIHDIHELLRAALDSQETE